MFKLGCTCLQKFERNWLADKINNTYRSAIAELFYNCNCTFSYSDDLFTVLSKSLSDFHLKVLETVHILTYKPSLCKFNQTCLNEKMLPKYTFSIHIYVCVSVYILLLFIFQALILGSEDKKNIFGTVCFKRKDFWRWKM